MSALGIIIIVLLIIVLLGGIPLSRSRGWGHGPIGLVGLLLIVVIVLFLMGRI